MEFYLPIAEMSINPLGFLVLGIIVGTLSGTFGVGGGFLMTPLLIFLGIPLDIQGGTKCRRPVPECIDFLLKSTDKQSAGGQGQSALIFS